MTPSKSVPWVLTGWLIATAASADDFVERMAREHADDTPVASPAVQTDPAGEVMSSEVSYAEFSGEWVNGYLARPVGDGPFPGVIVIQEWWGLNDNIRWMADRLAGEGYLALAVDLYEGEVGSDREGAMRLMQSAMERPERLVENLRQARAYLAARGATRIGTIGWCFGGGWSLRSAAALGDELDAAVIYYGRVLTDPADLEPIQAPVLGLFGADDGGIPVETVRTFETTMKSLGKSASIHIYEGANHAFANPSGTRYNEPAADDAWAKTLDFFAQHLGN